MFRQLFLVFHGNSRVDEHVKSHIHESPSVMTVPLIILAIGAILTGWLGASEYLWGSAWEHWLQPVFGDAHTAHGAVSTELLVTGLTLAVVGLGIYLAYARYGRAGTTAQTARAADTGLSRLLLNSYWIDDIYDFGVVRPFYRHIPMASAGFRSGSDRRRGQRRGESGKGFQPDLA
jgi:NADH-quinone oxidoreductase subunit L